MNKRNQFKKKNKPNLPCVSPDLFSGVSVITTEQDIERKKKKKLWEGNEHIDSSRKLIYNYIKLFSGKMHKRLFLLKLQSYTSWCLCGSVCLCDPLFLSLCVWRPFLKNTRLWPHDHVCDHDRAWPHWYAGFSSDDPQLSAAPGGTRTDFYSCAGPRPLSCCSPHPSRSHTLAKKKKQTDLIHM